MRLPRTRGERAACAAVLAVALVLLLPVSAQAAATIYFRGASSAQTGSGASSVTVSAPANTTVGDLLILDVDAEGTTSFSPPTGWTSIYAGTSDWSSSSATTYAVTVYRVATAADVGASYTISFATSRKAVARVLGYVGVNSSSPIDVKSAGSTGFATATSFSFPSVTTTQANDMVLLNGAFYNSSSTFAFTAPTGTHDRVNLKTSGSGSTVLGDNSDFTQATAASTGTKTGSLSPASLWGAVTVALAPAASGTLQFSTAPTSPSSIGSLTLNGHSQTLNAQMNNFAVDDTTGTGSGWHVQVNGNSNTGFSPVFARYCPASSGTCAGTSDGPGYVTGGQTLGSGSLTLNTTGASWSTTGGSGSAPTFSCSSGCTIDKSTATTIASAASGGAGAGPWSTSGLGSTSLALAAPTTVRAVPASEEYRVDLVWTLSSGP